MPLSQISGPPPDGLSIGLGVAAVILVAGWVFTRWHRDQMRFSLMRTALERGVTRFPGIPPYWIVSLRQGVTLVALGIGLGLVGSAAWWMVRGVEMPTVEQAKSTNLAVQPSPASQWQPPHERMQGEPRPEDRDFPPENGERPGPPPIRDDRGPGHSPQDGPPPREDRGPGHLQHNGPPPVREEHEGRRPDRANPPMGNPMMERWHRAEAQQTIGLVSVGAGLILMILGIVRIGFARIEQRYATESDDAGVY